MSNQVIVQVHISCIFSFHTLKNHSYSIRETAKFVALPGYSEHGDPNHQAIDFINENGVNQDRRKGI